MKPRKAVLVAGVAAVVLSIVTGAVAFAAGSSTASGYPPIVQTLAKKLNVSTATVKAAFNEEHQARQEERQTALEKQLDAAVKKGTITDAQRDTILAKMAAIQKKQEEVRSLNDDLRQWADDNNVDLATLTGGMGPGGRGMGGGPGMGGPGGGPPGP